MRFQELRMAYRPPVHEARRARAHRRRLGLWRRAIAPRLWGFISGLAATIEEANPAVFQGLKSW